MYEFSLQIRNFLKKMHFHNNYLLQYESHRTIGNANTYVCTVDVIFDKF